MRNVVAANLAAALGSLMLVGAALADPVSAGPAGPAGCPGNPDALGTSRTLVVDPTEHPKLGSMQYHETLPLEDHEIVLTFDDGPLPPRSSHVLDTLDHECVKATFFLVGKMAHAYPDVVKRIRDAGHTIATHSYSHPLTFHKMALDKAQAQINQGIAEVTAALGDGSGPSPFFRIPGLLRADGVERYAASQHLQVWSADFVADDWTRISPAQVYSRALQRIEAGHKGILLLHDIQAKTVEALPYLLRELKKRGYKIVHVVPATAERPKTVTEPGQWMLHPRQVSRTPIFMKTAPGLPAPSPASFGMDVGSKSISFFQKISLARDPAWRASALTQPFDKARSAQGLPDQFYLPAADAAAQNIASTTPGGEPDLFDVVGEAHGSEGNEIQRLLESLPEEAAPPAAEAAVEGGQTATPPLRRRGGLAANAPIPHGAFP